MSIEYMIIYIKRQFKMVKTMMLVLLFSQIEWGFGQVADDAKRFDLIEFNADYIFAKAPAGFKRTDLFVQNISYIEYFNDSIYFIKSQYDILVNINTWKYQVVSSWYKSGAMFICIYKDNLSLIDDRFNLIAKIGRFEPSKIVDSVRFRQYIHSFIYRNNEHTVMFDMDLLTRYNKQYILNYVRTEFGIKKPELKYFYSNLSYKKSALAGDIDSFFVDGKTMFAVKNGKVKTVDRIEMHGYEITKNKIKVTNEDFNGVYGLHSIEKLDSVILFYLGSNDTNKYFISTLVVNIKGWDSKLVQFDFEEFRRSMFAMRFNQVFIITQKDYQFFLTILGPYPEIKFSFPDDYEFSGILKNGILLKDKAQKLFLKPF